MQSTFKNRNLQSHDIVPVNLEEESIPNCCAGVGVAEHAGGPHQQGGQGKFSLKGTIITKDYIDQIDVQSQINQPKELPTTGHFCVLLKQPAWKLTPSSPTCVSLIL